jgi:hypothetical protein
VLRSEAQGLRRGVLPRRTSRRAPVHALLALLLGGCGASLQQPDRAAETLLPARADVLVAGVSDRAAVTQALGAPLLSHPAWRMALYRDATTQGATQFALTPWPVPFAHITDLLERLTLVVFDTAGRVEAFDSGIIRRPPDWRSASPIRFDHPWLTLRAGDLVFSFASNVGRTDTLLAGPASRDAWVEAARASERCTLLLTCGTGGCGERIAIDGGEERSLPLRLLPYEDLVPERPRNPTQVPWIDTFAPVGLPPGAHEITFSSAALDGRHSARVECPAGAVLFVTQSATLTRGGREFAAWTVEFAPALPPTQAGRPLALFHEGRWLVDAPAGR